MYIYVYIYIYIYIYIFYFSEYTMKDGRTRKDGQGGGRGSRWEERSRLFGSSNVLFFGDYEGYLSHRFLFLSLFFRGISLSRLSLKKMSLRIDER